MERKIKFSNAANKKWLLLQNFSAVLSGPQEILEKGKSKPGFSLRMMSIFFPILFENLCLYHPSVNSLAAKLDIMELSLSYDPGAFLIYHLCSTPNPNSYYALHGLSL